MDFWQTQAGYDFASRLLNRLDRIADALDLIAIKIGDEEK